MPFTSIQNPANPAWDCCQNAPALVVGYRDGSAGVICAKDAHHFSKADQRPLPEGWKPSTPLDQARVLVEIIREYHFMQACNEDQSQYNMSHAMLRLAIAAAYPDYDTNVLVNLWVDNNESIAYQVELIESGKVDPEGWR